MNDDVLCYNKVTEPTKQFNALRICIPEARLKEVFQICHEWIASEYRGVAGTLDKFQRTFFVLLARDKIRRLVERCDICLTKKRSIKPKMVLHLPSTCVGNVGEKVFIDLVTLSETIRKNCYLLTVQEEFTRFTSQCLSDLQQGGWNSGKSFNFWTFQRVRFTKSDIYLKFKKNNPTER